MRKTQDVNYPKLREQVEAQLSESAATLEDLQGRRASLTVDAVFDAKAMQELDRVEADLNAAQVIHRRNQSALQEINTREADLQAEQERQAAQEAQEKLEAEYAWLLDAQSKLLAKLETAGVELEALVRDAVEIEKKLEFVSKDLGLHMPNGLTRPYRLADFLIRRIEAGGIHNPAKTAGTSRRVESLVKGT